MATSIELVHPAAVTFENKPKKSAERQGTVKGRKVVLFSNNKPNVHPFHEELQAYFTQHAEADDIQVMKKHAAAMPADESLVEQIRTFDFAVNAIGD